MALGAAVLFFASMTLHRSLHLPQQHVSQESHRGWSNGEATTHDTNNDAIDAWLSPDLRTVVARNS